ncbi:hypothetical protein FQR65_LT10708 [Abscondita terminalis]|nr:hypothetical protein FQR65_LT10708 [Abscondita terminalis]
MFKFLTQLLNVCVFKTMFTNFVLIVLITIAIVIFTYLTRSFSYWSKKGVYSQQPTIPFGNAQNLITQKCCLGKELWNVYNHFKQKSLPFGGYYFMTKPIFIPIDLNLIKRILITDFEHFTNHTLFSEKYDPLSRNLFALKGSEWRTMRGKLSPAFTITKIKTLFGTMSKCLDDFINILDDAALDSKTIEAKDLLCRLTIDVIATCAFGFESNSVKNPNSRIRKITSKFFHYSMRNSVIFLFAMFAPQILCFFKIKFTQKDIHDFFINLTKETVRFRETNKIIRPDFVHLLLQIKNNAKISDEDIGNFEQLGTETQLTIHEMAAQCMIFFVGGFETTWSTITYCLYELCKNIDVQDKAREEVQSKILEGKVTYEVLQQLPYLEQVIFESMRKYPPAPMHARECTKKYTVPNTEITIEKGCFVYIPLWGIQMDPEIYPDPEKFDPDRFSPENVNRRHSCAWLPFGDGPRTCIAYQFGLLEAKLVLTTLLSRYQFTLNAQTKEPLEVDPKAMLLMPSNEIWINFNKL